MPANCHALGQVLRFRFGKVYDEGVRESFPPIQLARCQNPEGETMSNLDNALRELRQRRSGMQVELEKLDHIISGIESLNGAGSRSERNSRPPGAGRSARA